MQNIKHIDVAGTKILKGQGATIFDIRDTNNFTNGHIQGAVHLTNENIQELMAETPTDKSIVIYCYHGISSQQAAQYLVAQGFADVYSMDGGYDAWRMAESQ